MFPKANIINDQNVGEIYGINDEFYEYTDKKENQLSDLQQDEKRFQKFISQIKKNDEKIKRWKGIIEDSKGSDQDKFLTMKSFKNRLNMLTYVHLSKHQELIIIIDSIIGLRNEKISINHPRFLGALKIAAKYIKTTYDLINQDTILCFVSDTGIIMNLK